MPSSSPASINDVVTRLVRPTGAGEFVRRHVVSGIVNVHCPIGGRVIDLGAGAGNLFVALRPDLRQGYAVVDIERRGFGRRIVGDVTTVPLAADSADCVCLSDVLEHLVQDADAVQEAVRVVRPGAQVVLHVPSTRTKPFRFLRRAAEGAESVDHQQFPHVRDGYTTESLSAMLNEVVGAEVVYIRPSFSASQSLLTDIDAYLWWHKWTPLRPATWLGIRLTSLRGRRNVPATSSSGLVAVLRKIAG